MAKPLVMLCPSLPLAVRENTNLDATTRLLLETKCKRLPVVDSIGKLVSGFILAVHVPFFFNKINTLNKKNLAFLCIIYKISIQEIMYFRFELSFFSSDDLPSSSFMILAYCRLMLLWG